MKIGVISCSSFNPGKVNIIDSRVKTLKQMFNSPKEVYIQAEIVTDQAKLFETDGLICPQDNKLDVIVNDMEFVETRLQRAADTVEKAFLERCRQQLEKEMLISDMVLSEAEKALAASYSMLSVRPVCLASAEELENKDALLFKAYYHSGFISFFTAGDKDSHAWSIRKGQTAYEAAGAIHTDIQRGFIRAEVVGFDQLVQDGSLSKARAGNHLRLEMKDYVVQDGDYLVIRTNK